MYPYSKGIYYPHMDTTKKTQAVRILIFAVIIAVIVIVMSFVAGSANTSTKYNTFAQCLKQKGLEFYGAFWCPHCQAQKAAFGASVEYLPYNECSNADKSAMCNALNVESYPTWVFPTAITVNEPDAPVVCQAQPGPADQPSECAEEGSAHYMSWIFSDVHVESSTAPTQSGTSYTFAAGSRTVGELSMQTLSDFSGCALPQ